MSFSIIIPHKNRPVLLQKLLRSIPNRDDLETIIVDDNSDSEIVDFHSFPGLTKPNTTIIYDKIGGGGGYARNLGLKHARGQWIIFADSDDLFTSNLAHILEEYKDNLEDV